MRVVMLMRAMFVAAAVSSGAVCAAPITHTFIDRENADDLRVASFNVYNDSIFNSRSAKFGRMAAAIDADVWAFQEVYNTPAATVKTLMDTVQPLGTPNGWYVYRPHEDVIASRFPLSLIRANTSPTGRGFGIALIDLPAARFGNVDLYMMNCHYTCCGGTSNDPSRQRDSDALVNWMRDARTPGGLIDLPYGTAMMVLGDLNIVGGPQPLTTLLDGNIQNNITYGADSPPDWDGTNNALVQAQHNMTGAEMWTWRDDTQIFDPSRLDYITYTDSVLSLRKSFVLNTVTMNAADRAAAGLQIYDSILDNAGITYDHLPVVADFTLAPEPSSIMLLTIAGVQLLARRRR